MTISGNCPVFLCLFIDLSGHVHWTVRPESPVDKLSGWKMSRKRTGQWPENDRKIHQKIWILGMVLSSHVRPDSGWTTWGSVKHSKKYLPQFFFEGWWRDLHSALYLEFCELPLTLHNSSNVGCKLCQSLYETKQGAHTWYLEVIQIFTSLGYTVLLAEEAVFYRFGCDIFSIVAVTTVISLSYQNLMLQQNYYNRRFKNTGRSQTLAWLIGSSVSRLHVTLRPRPFCSVSSLTLNKYSSILS